MRDSCSIEAPLGYASVTSDHSTMSFFSAWLGRVRLHIGKIGNSTRVQVRRTMFLGLYASVWEVLGPVGSKHRLPNGMTIEIGAEKPGTYNDIPVTLLQFEAAPAMWRKAKPIEAT